MMFKRGPLEIEFEWDHGPDLTIVFYGHRTHILSASWSAYPVLGGRPALRKDDLYDPPHFWGPLERMVKAAYEITHDPLTEAIEEVDELTKRFLDHDARTLEFPSEGLYEITFFPPGDEGIRRLMEELPVPPPGKTLSVKALMDAMWRAVGPDAKPPPGDVVA